MKDNLEQSECIIISVVIPAFNEEENIRIVVEKTLQTLRQQYREDLYEIIVVNDGSHDRTGQICEELQQQHQSVRVFHHPKNQGIGAAQTTGFINAKGGFVSTIPGDGQVTVDQVIKLYTEIGDAGIIVSSRRNDEQYSEKQARSFYREFLTSVLRQILILVHRFDIAGKHGIFLIRRDVLQKLRLTSLTGLLTPEIIMQCYRKGVTVKESTITIEPRISGQSKVTNLSTYLKYFWEIFKLRINS